MCADTEPPSTHSRKKSPAASSFALSGAKLDTSLEASIASVIASNRPSSKSTAFRKKYFPTATLADWNDWKWQLTNRLTTAEDLERFLELSRAERSAFTNDSTVLPCAVTPYYASLLRDSEPLNPLRRSVIPTDNEHVRSPGEADDPLCEDLYSPHSCLVHRYPDRVLFLVTTQCATYCRYCTRSRMVGKPHETGTRASWEEALDYIRSTPTIRDVLISGGDPLTLADDQLEWLLSRLRAIQHVEIIRIGTKTPAVLPQRINLSLIRILKRFHPLFISIHITHPSELTREMNQACIRLADAGIPLGSQTVLLAGINDDAETMKLLTQSLLKIRVRPYYLYQCDPITGSSHFRTPIAKGIDITRSLRGFTSGYAVPTFVVDAPGGGGKIPLATDYTVGKEGGDLILRNFRGDRFRYPDYAGATPVRFKQMELPL